MYDYDSGGEYFSDSDDDDMLFPHSAHEIFMSDVLRNATIHIRNLGGGVGGGISTVTTIGGVGGGDDAILPTTAASSSSSCHHHHHHHHHHHSYGNRSSASSSSSSNNRSSSTSSSTSAAAASAASSNENGKRTIDHLKKEDNNSSHSTHTTGDELLRTISEEEREKSKRDEVLSTEFDQLQEQIINERVRKRCRLSMGLGYTVGDETEQEDEITRLVFAQKQQKQMENERKKLKKQAMDEHNGQNGHFDEEKGQKEENSEENYDDDDEEDEYDDEQSSSSPLRGIPCEITEQVVRTYSLSSNFNEGLELIHCVKSLTMGLDGKLKADVTVGNPSQMMIPPHLRSSSSASASTTVQICLHFKRKKYLIERSCSACGNNTVLWCKHVVAVILKALRSPDQVLYLGAFDDIAREAQKGNYLAEAINNISQGNAALIHQLMKELQKLREERRKAKDDMDSLSNSKTFAPFTKAKIPPSKLEQLLPVAAQHSERGHYINEKKILEEVAAACLKVQTGSTGCDRYSCSCRCHRRVYHALDSSDEDDDCYTCRNSSSYGNRFGPLNDTVTMYRDAAVRMIERGGRDMETGLRILDSVISGLLTFDFGATSLRFNGSALIEQYDKLLGSLSTIIRTVMLLPEDKLSAKTRDYWKEMLPTWNCILEGVSNGKVKSNFNAAADAAINGWHSEMIQKVLRGDESVMSSFSESKEIADIRLGILIEQKEIRKAMNYARAVDRPLTVICMLLSDRKFDEALECANSITNLHDLTTFIFASVCFVEFVLEPEEDVLREGMIDFVSEVGNDQSKAAEKAFEFFLGVPEYRSELEAKVTSGAELTQTEREVVQFLDKMFDLVLKRFVELQEQDKTKSVKNRVVVELKMNDNNKQKYSLLNSVFNTRWMSTYSTINSVIVNVDLKVYVLATLLNLFPHRCDSLIALIKQVCTPSVDADLLVYLSLLLLSAQQVDNEAAYQLGVSGLEHCNSERLIKLFCSLFIGKSEQYSRAICLLLSTKKFESMSMIDTFAECVPEFKDPMDQLQILKNMARQVVSVALQFQTPLSSSIIIKCLSTAINISNDAITKVIDLVLSSFDFKSKDCVAYFRKHAYTVRNLILGMIPHVNGLSTSKPICSLCQFALDFLDVITVRKPAHSVLVAKTQFVTRKPTISCSCADCALLSSFMGRSNDTKTKEWTLQRTSPGLCYVLQNLVRSVSSTIKDYVTVDYKEAENKIIATKTPQYLEALSVINDEEKAYEYSDTSNIISKRLIEVMTQVRSVTDSNESSLCDFLLDRIENSNSENSAILVSVLDYLFTVQKYERAIKLATKLLHMPNDNSSTAMHEIMTRLIQACQAQAIQLKKEDKLVESGAMQNQAIEFAKKLFLLQKSVSTFENLKQLYKSFDMTEEWNTKVRSDLLIQFLNEVHPENVSITSVYNIPSAVRVTFELLIADSYLAKANEILQALIKKHTTGTSSAASASYIYSNSQYSNSEIISGVFDIVFQMLAKYRIHEQLVKQIFEPTVKDYATKLLVLPLERTTNKYNARRAVMASTSTTTIENATQDRFWDENRSDDRFERDVLEKWCLVMCPDVVLWYSMEKLSTHRPSIKVATYPRVVSLMLKIKKSMELCEKKETEWTTYLNTFLAQIKTKKKLVRDIQEAVTLSGAFAIKARPPLLKRLQDLQSPPTAASSSTSTTANSGSAR